MDINNFKLKENAAQGAVMVVRNPVTNEETDFKITLIGKDAPRYTELRDQLYRGIASRRASLGKIDPADIKEADRTLFVGSTLGWEGLAEGGVALPFDPTTATRLYEQHDWLVEQVAQFIENRANFTKG
jgi:hypothetical protein